MSLSLKTKLSSLLITVSLAGTTILINHLYNSSSKKKDTSPINTSNLIRENLFEDKKIVTNQLNNLINHLEKSKIDKDQLNLHLKPFIQEALKKLSKKQGKNPEEIAGKIYYDIKERSIELFILWKTNLYDSNFKKFDRFEIKF